MNAFVRRLAVISVLWAAVEMLVPEGRQQPALRMTMGILMMTAVLSQAGQWFGAEMDMPAWSLREVRADYRQTALKAAANQVEGYCVLQAEKAGYCAEGGVWIGQDGSIEHISLRIRADGSPLIPPERLREHLAQQLQIPPDRIRLEET